MAWHNHNLCFGLSALILLLHLNGAISQCTVGTYSGTKVPPSVPCLPGQEDLSCFDQITLNRRADCTFTFTFLDSRCGTGNGKHFINPMHTSPTAPAGDPSALLNNTIGLMVSSENDVVKFTAPNLPKELVPCSVRGYSDLSWNVPGWNTQNKGTVSADKLFNNQPSAATGTGSNSKPAQSAAPHVAVSRSAGGLLCVFVLALSMVA